MLCCVSVWVSSCILFVIPSMFNWSMLSVLIVFIVGGLGGGTLMGGEVEG